MSSLSDKLSKFFKPKSEKLKKERVAKKLGIPLHILEMPEGSDKDRALAVHEANKKAKERDSYECGGVKYSKLKKRMKKGKK